MFLVTFKLEIFNANPVTNYPQASKFEKENLLQKYSTIDASLREASVYAPQYYSSMNKLNRNEAPSQNSQKQNSTNGELARKRRYYEYPNSLSSTNTVNDPIFSTTVSQSFSDSDSSSPIHYVLPQPYATPDEPFGGGFNALKDDHPVGTETSFWPPKQATPSSSYGEIPSTFPYSHSSPPDLQREVRFLIYKPADEELVKSTVIEDAKLAGNTISFIQGPDLQINQHQKVHLPPMKKSIVYILLKEPEIKTNVELIEPDNHEESKPEVHITYETNNGVIKNHYDLTPEEGSRVAEVLASKIRQTRETMMELELKDTKSEILESGKTATEERVICTSDNKPVECPKI